MGGSMATVNAYHRPSFPPPPPQPGIATSRLWEEQARAFDELRSDLARLASENRRYREALAFVADTETGQRGRGPAHRLRECVDVATWALRGNR